MNPSECSPVANMGRMKVIAVDYRDGPGVKFPAASEDVTAVYKEVLKSYQPQDIGIYGISSGGMLVAEMMAWIEKERLPPPGAIAILFSSADGWVGGDSGVLAVPLIGVNRDSLDPPHPSVNNDAYFSDADINDPLVSPIRSSAVLAKFPPTLIITSTRDYAMSPAVFTHARLIKLGVNAELHVWEGLIHTFTGDPELPESREAWAVVVKFFDSHLSKR